MMDERQGLRSALDVTIRSVVFLRFCLTRLKASIVFEFSYDEYRYFRLNVTTEIGKLGKQKMPGFDNS
jgi:hypothetical protein